MKKSTDSVKFGETGEMEGWPVRGWSSIKQTGCAASIGSQNSRSEEMNEKIRLWIDRSALQANSQGALRIWKLSTLCEAIRHVVK